MYSYLIELFSRKTTSGRFIPLIDGLRFIAIASVFIQHVQQVLLSVVPAEAPLVVDLFGRLVRDWRIGVELFFVISGFILALPFAQHALGGGKPVDIKAYFLRRITRLEPPYLISLAFCFAMQVWWFGKSATGLLGNLLASVFYAHNIAYDHFSLINTVAWSLEIEVQFYCMAPILALALTVKNKLLRRSVLVGIGLASFACKQVLAARFGEMPMNITYHLHYFMAGFLLADIHVSDWKGDPRRAWGWDAVALVTWLGIPFLFLWNVPARSIVMAVLLFVAVYSTWRSRAVVKLFELGPVRTLGGMCYSIYLLHYVLIWALGPELLGVNPDASLGVNTLYWSAVLALVTLPLYLAFFLLLEKPCMDKNWPSKLMRFLRGAPKAGAT